MIEGINQI